MVKRDLKADLEFCDRATQGPWKHEWNPDYSEVYAPGFDNPIILVRHDPYDADFIVQAREGWPHAIERAIKAEKALGNETILNGKALAKLNERADKAETLARELVEALEVAFELLEDHQPNWYLRMHFSQINNALGSYKEVLENEIQRRKD